LSTSSEYVIDGNVVNKLLEQYNFEAFQPTSQLHHMLPGQVYDIIEKKFLKTLTDEIGKANPQTVRFTNLEAIASGPHKEYLNAICGGLGDLIDTLSAKNIQVTGEIQNPLILPWSFVVKIDKNFKGIPAPGETIPP
jgi:hypothetical protein